MTISLERIDRPACPACRGDALLLSGCPCGCPPVAACAGTGRPSCRWSGDPTRLLRHPERTTST